MLKRGRATTVVDEKQRTKNEALASALEKATSPLADKVSGSEEEMGKLREKLMNAGFRRDTSPVVFKGMQLILAGVGAVLGGAFGLFADGLTQGHDDETCRRRDHRIHVAAIVA